MSHDRSNNSARVVAVVDFPSAFLMLDLVVTRVVDNDYGPMYRYTGFRTGNVAVGFFFSLNRAIDALFCLSSRVGKRLNICAKTSRRPGETGYVGTPNPIVIMSE